MIARTTARLTKLKPVRATSSAVDDRCAGDDANHQRVHGIYHRLRQEDDRSRTGETQELHAIEALALSQPIGDRENASRKRFPGK